MKKFISIVLCLIMSVSFCFTTRAEDSAADLVVETFEDGSYIEAVVIEEETSLFSSASQKSGSKTYTYKNSSGKMLWSITISGTFSYNGTSSKCTGARVSTNCPGKGWKLSKKTAGKSGAVATASATFKQYKSGSVVKTLTRSVSLTCSKTGKLS